MYLPKKRKFIFASPPHPSITETKMYRASGAKISRLFKPMRLKRFNLDSLTFLVSARD